MVKEQMSKLTECKKNKKNGINLSDALAADRQILRWTQSNGNQSIMNCLTFSMCIFSPVETITLFNEGFEVVWY